MFGVGGGDEGYSGVQRNAAETVREEHPRFS